MLADQSLAAELEAALPVLREEASRPAGLEGVKRVVGRRFALFIQPERSDAEWAEWWNDYAAAIGHMPAAALEAAMQEHVSKPDAKFLPMPGELLAAARKAVYPAGRRYSHAASAANSYKFRLGQGERVEGTSAEEPLPPRKEPTEQERAAVKKMLAEYLAQDDIRRAEAMAKRMVPPPVQARVDETGISDELRQLVREQRGGELSEYR